MSLLEILCSSRFSCSSCVLRLWRFVVEVLRGFRGLNPLSFTDLWFVKVFGGFWAWFQWTSRSRQVVWMILLQMFFVFEGLWWKSFGALEAWIRRVSPIYGLLRFLEAFELDFSDLWDLGRWFGWFLFECSSYSKLKFLEASKLGSNRAFGLLNLDLLQLFSLSPLSAHLQLQPPRNALGRLLFIGVWRWVRDTWQSIIGDTCHSLIGSLMSSLTHERLLVSSLTRARLLVSSLTRALMRDLFLHDTWQISVGFWVVIAKSSRSTWRFVIGCILWTW